MKPRREAGILQQIAKEACGRLVCLACRLLGINWQKVAGGGHGDVKEAALLLFVKCFVVALRGRIGVIKLPWKFEQGFFVSRGERWGTRAKNKNVLELKPLGGVCGN